MKGDAGYFGQLAQDGFDVYVYDQVGAAAPPASPTREATPWSATSPTWRRFGRRSASSR